MAWYSQEESIDEVYCSKCKSHLNAKKKMEIWKPPKMFIIHLKRFVEYNNHWIKSNRLVEFPVTGLDPSSWMVEQPPTPLLYDLYATVNHVGRLGHGHYTAFAKKDDVWRCYDDSKVTPVEETKVISPSAYLLFYKLRDVEASQILTGHPVEVQNQGEVVLGEIPQKDVPGKKEENCSVM